MMTRSELITQLKQAEPALRERGVAALYYYGSYARDEATAGSDIDVFVELQKGQEARLTDYLSPYHLLEEHFPGTPIGYGTRANIAPSYRSEIDRTAIRIF